MRFDFAAYEQVYGNEMHPAAPIESAVDTYKPTEAESSKAKDDQPGEETPAPAPAPDESLADAATEAITKAIGSPDPEGVKNE